MTPQIAGSFCSECGRPAPPDQLARFGDRLVCPYCKEAYAQKLREGVAPAQAMRYAGFWLRVAAYLIDLVILLIIESIVDAVIFGSSMMVMPTPAPNQNPFEVLGPMFARMGSTMLANTLITALYYTLFVGSLAATPGKLALGLKIVRADGSKVSYARAFARYCAEILSALVLCIGFIMVGFDSEKRGLHDMICDTRVIKTRA